MVVRRPTTPVSTKKSARKGAVTGTATSAQQKGAAKKVAPKRAAAPSKAAIMLEELRPSVEALYDRVEKLRLRFS